MTDKRVRVTKENVPIFLQHSKKCEEMGEERMVPKQYICRKIRPRATEEDFLLVLKMLIYWEVYELPHIIYAFIFINRNLNYKLVLNDKSIKSWNKRNELIELYKFVTKKHKLYKDLRQYCRVQDHYENFQTYCAEYGYINLMQYIYKLCGSYGLSAKFAALGDKYELLEFLIQKGVQMRASTCAYAASGKSLRCLKLAYDNGCYWNKDVYIEAIKKDAIDIVQFAIENGCPFDDFTQSSKKYRPSTTYVNSDKVTSVAAAFGRIEMLKLFNKHNFPFGRLTTASACKNGRTEVLKYLISIKCKIDDHSLTEAIDNGHAECFGIALKALDIQLKMYIYTIKGKAINHSNPAFLQHLLDNGITFNEFNLNNEISHAPLSNIKLVVEKFPDLLGFSNELINLALKYGRNDVVNFFESLHK